MMKKTVSKWREIFCNEAVEVSRFMVFPYDLVQRRMCFISFTCLYWYCANKPVAYFAMNTNLLTKVTLRSEKCFSLQ